MDKKKVRETFLSAGLQAGFQVSFDRMASQGFLDFVWGKKLDPELPQKLKRKMLSAQAVLKDAEDKKNRNPFVEHWLDELGKAIKEANDLIEKINDKKLKKDSGSKSKKVINSITTKFSAFNRTVEDKLLAILDRLNDILEQKDYLGLREDAGCNGTSGSSLATSSEAASASGVDENSQEMLEHECC